MNAILFHPLGIYVFGLGGGFLIPILYQMSKRWLNFGFVVAMLGLTLCAVVPAIRVLLTGEVIEITTAGALPPISINLRFGPWEAVVSASASLAAAIVTTAFWQDIKSKYVPLLLMLIATMGVNGLIQTRDLFNQFVFLEILSVGTYGLLALSRSREGVQAAFKYVIVTMVASVLVLLGAVLLYEATGHLNIDALIEAGPAVGAGLSGVALTMLLAGFLIELKPYPAGGWGLDVYETAPPPLAAFLSVVGSAGLIFAVAKLLPLFMGVLDLLCWSAALTFLASNLAGLRQKNVFRLLGYSSIGQMALLLMALTFLTKIGATDLMPFILFGLFINHLLAKAGLFSLSGVLKLKFVDDPFTHKRRSFYVIVLGIFIVAISGLPPFPGFWAKWELILRLAVEKQLVLIFIVLAGSLCEATYLFRWFFNSMGAHRDRASDPDAEINTSQVLDSVAPALFAVFLVGLGATFAAWSDAFSLPLVLPLAAGSALVFAEPLPGRVKALLMLGVVGVGAILIPQPGGIAGLLSPILLAGGLVIAAAGLAFPGKRPAHYPLVAVLLLSIQSLLTAPTGLAFYTAWEYITLASTFLIARHHSPSGEALRFLVFSLAAAFCLMAGFALVTAESGSRAIYAVANLNSEWGLAILLLVTGFLIKTATVGVHIWLPGAYASADDDVTALLSGVVSKTAIFGLLLTCYLALRSEASIEVGYLLAWAGMATTVFGALMALRQVELKRLLAYSSLSQLGYIVVAIGLMGHLGWVTALYLVASHLLAKGILFLALAGVKMRVGSSTIGEIPRLLRPMPLTAITVGIALLSMSGLPPLMGFGAKWLLLAAVTEKGWSGMALAGGIATFLGLWYILRIFVALFFAGKSDDHKIREAPIALLAPQILLIGGIVVLSLFPKLLMGLVSNVIDPEFAATLVWEGQSLETIYGLWDPSPTMLSAVSLTFLIAVLWYGAARIGKKAPNARAAILFQTPIPSRFMPSLTEYIWNGLSNGVCRLADLLRGVYSGRTQDYILQALLYFLAFYCLIRFYVA